MVSPLRGDEYEVSVMGMPFCHISHSNLGGELATSGGFSPFGAYGTTFPPLCGGTTTRALLRVTYENTTSRSFIVPPLAGERWWRQPPKGGDAFPTPARAVVRFY